jgi:hypothetical protein
MRSRRLLIAIAHLVGFAALVIPLRTVLAQPSEEGVDRAAELQRLISDVEARRRVLVRARGGLLAISADQVGELFATQVLTGDMPADSIVPYALRVRERSDSWLLDLKRQLAALQGSQGVPNDVLLQWKGAAGTWSMACQGSYPPTVRGDVGNVYMREPPSRSRWFHADLTLGTLQAPVTSLSGTVIGGAAKGENRSVQMPRTDFNDVETLIWDALVMETSPAADGVDGTIEASGALTLTGNDGSCRGRWRTP